MKATIDYSYDDGSVFFIDPQGKFSPFSDAPEVEISDEFMAEYVRITAEHTALQKQLSEMFNTEREKRK